MTRRVLLTALSVVLAWALAVVWSVDTAFPDQVPPVARFGLVALTIVTLVLTVRAWRTRAGDNGAGEDGRG